MFHRVHSISKLTASKFPKVAPFSFNYDHEVSISGMVFV